MSPFEFVDAVEDPSPSRVGPLGHGAPADGGEQFGATGLLPSAVSVASVPAADAEGGRDEASPVPTPRLPRRIRFRWCLRCEARDRLHVHDVCQVCGTWSR